MSHAFPSAAPGTSHSCLLQNLHISSCGKEGKSAMHVFLCMYTYLWCLLSSCNRLNKQLFSRVSQVLPLCQAPRNTSLLLQSDLIQFTSWACPPPFPLYISFHSNVHVQTCLCWKLIDWRSLHTVTAASLYTAVVQ